MTSRTVLLPVSKLMPGMVLSDDLRDSWGHILLPQGSQLTELTLEALKRYDVTELPILLKELSAEELAEKASQQLQRIGLLFRKSADNKAAQLLMQYLHTFRQGE